MLSKYYEIVELPPSALLPPPNSSTDHILNFIIINYNYNIYVCNVVIYRSNYIFYISKMLFWKMIIGYFDFLDVKYKDMTIGVYGSYRNFTVDTNVTDECGRSELLQQCTDQSMFVYGFQLPVTRHLTDYFISTFYRQVDWKSIKKHNFYFVLNNLIKIWI